MDMGIPSNYEIRRHLGTLCDSCRIRPIRLFVAPDENGRCYCRKCAETFALPEPSRGEGSERG